MSRRHRRNLGPSLLALLAACGGSNAATERVTLPPGTSFPALTDSLSAHGVIGSPRWFRVLARVRGVDRSVQAGVYEFGPGLSAWEVLDILSRGKAAAQRFTVPEGLTVEELAVLAEQRLGIPADSLRAAAADTAAAREILGLQVRSFEGFLRPETYTLPIGVGARELVRVMAEGFRKQWKPEWAAQLDSLKMSRLELVTFASIVEGEARVDDERETIAGVYHNRLRIGMPLQADPTVQYALMEQTGERKPRLYYNDYRFESPYNTYLMRGLPPGPVGAPSRASILAVLRPAEVPYLYFVARPDGRHTFSRNYNDHLRAIAESRRRSKAVESGQSQ